MKISEAVLRFCALLRADYGFRLSIAEATDALRAIERVGVSDVRRFRTALRLVCCSTFDEIGAFERAFDAFFLSVPRGLPQSDYAPRHSRPRPVDDEDGAQVRWVREPGAGGDDAAAWQTLSARYSAAAASTPPPQIPEDGLAEMLGAASRLIASLHLGRSRKWRPMRRGRRFDLRRTLRASLGTGGDPVTLRRLGHPRRNPRFVVLLDGSRSMTEHGPLMLQFAYALARRSSRVHVYVFSTALREVTAELRGAGAKTTAALDAAGEAWGGGTRIGDNLLRFVREHSGRMAADDTATIIVSDGLDTGDVPRLSRAMRAIRRRSAAVVWINPNAAVPAYSPQTRGMRAALPYVDALVGATDARGYGNALRRRRKR